jgi:hypothetical protein
MLLFGNSAPKNTADSFIAYYVRVLLYNALKYMFQYIKSLLDGLYFLFAGLLVF